MDEGVCKGLKMAYFEMEPNFAVQNFKNYARYDHNSFSRLEIHIRGIPTPNGLVISFVDPKGVGKNHFFSPRKGSWNNRVQISFS